MTDIYHLTHVRHLAAILAEDGLHCDAMVGRRRLSTVSIAHESLKAKRARTLVPVPPGGYLCDYVPFYFAPRSPMLYAISRGRVEG